MSPRPPAATKRPNISVPSPRTRPQLKQPHHTTPHHPLACARPLTAWNQHPGTLLLWRKEGWCELPSCVGAEEQYTRTKIKIFRDDEDSPKKKKKTQARRGMSGDRRKRKRRRKRSNHKYSTSAGEVCRERRKIKEMRHPQHPALASKSRKKCNIGEIPLRSIIQCQDELPPVIWRPKMVCRIKTARLWLDVGEIFFEVTYSKAFTTGVSMSFVRPLANCFIVNSK